MFSKRVWGSWLFLRAGAGVLVSILEEGERVRLAETACVMGGAKGSRHAIFQCL
jgi:hypothetical protein